MRPLSNLKADPTFRLSAAKLRTGFVGLYAGKFGSRNTLVDLAYYLSAGALAVGGRGDVNTNADDRRLTVETYCRDKDRKWVVRSSLRKNNALKRLEFRTPIFHSFDGNILTNLGLFRPPGFNQLSAQDQEAWSSCNSLRTGPMGNGKIILGAEVAATFNLPKATMEAVKQSLISLEATSVGTDMALWATWAIEKEEAEYLTNSSFVEMRLSDIYPTLIEWTATVFGRFGRLPKSISKISKIASSVKESLQGSSMRPRVGVDNMVTDINGDFYVIPEVDQSSMYEQQLMDFGLQENGSYTWRPDHAEGDNNLTVNIDAEGNTVPRRKLPANMPIFSDWLNDKFVYSNTAGNLATYESWLLEQYRSSHR